MLESLHVKNLALIDEAEVNFTPGLNILTGETGAGKSIIIGSINLALGAKADKDYIRTGAEYALVELTFSLNPLQCQSVREMDLPVEEGDILVLQRKIMAGRSVCRVNGESVSTAQLKALAGYLLDLYGQHEHQSLLKPSRHKLLLDEYAGSRMTALKAELKQHYKAYKNFEEELSENQTDEVERQRETDLLHFEVNEIEAAALIPGEDEAAEKVYRKMINSKRVKETVALVHSLTGYEENGCAGETIGRALRELKSAGNFDEEAVPYIEQLTDIDNLLNDFNRSMADYRESLEFDEEEFLRLEERLNILNHLKNKYGKNIEGILEELEEKGKRLEHLANYEAYLNSLQEKLRKEKESILTLCKKISKLRNTAAAGLSEKLKAAMVDLNFIDVAFSISVLPDEAHFSDDGYDTVEFLISTNPGEKQKPLQQIASGGELSRIMLAFKTVFADKDGTDTLVFDEIDTGISGKTAWKVSEKLGQLSRNHQIICITHLPQIAAMSDSHFLIEKGMKENRTVTNIFMLEEQQSLNELARLLGSGAVTEAVLTNAREMKDLAVQSKK